MDRKKKLAYAGAGLMFILLVAGLIFLTAAVTDRNVTHQGIQEGFKLNGSYTQPGQIPGMSTTLTFDMREDAPMWRMQAPGEDNRSGRVGKTVDPNVYLLKDAADAEIGWAHLAYANLKGEGTLFIRFGVDEPFEMEKFDRVIVTFEPPV